MPVELRIFVQHEFERAEEFIAVSRIGSQLLEHLNTPTAQDEIALADRPGAPSSSIQAVLRDFSVGLGFTEEAKGLFAAYETSALRPDYYLRLGRTGILLEVERGKTTINNMDLLDFWKCHLCEHAHYLFLVVPKALRQNEQMAPRNEFASVCKRLASFFKPGSYTNVRGLFVFGY